MQDQLLAHELDQLKLVAYFIFMGLFLELDLTEMDINLYWN